MAKRVIGIYLDEAVLLRLPKRGRSAYINSLLRKHLAEGSITELTEQVSEILIGSNDFIAKIDQRIHDTLQAELRQVQQETNFGA